MTRIQERLFNPGEMAIPMWDFVRAKLEGFSLRQAARAEKRQRQREKRNEDATGETQISFGFDLESLLEQTRAQRWTARIAV